MKPATNKPTEPKPCVRCKTPTRQHGFVCAVCLFDPGPANPKKGRKR